MKPLSLSNRLFLVMAVALLPAVGILVSSVLVSQSTNERSLHQQAARTSELVGLELERIISGAEDVLRALAVTPIVRRGDTEVCSSLVTAMADAVPSLSAIAVINIDGYTRCAPIDPSSALFLGDREYFSDALATDERVVGIYTIGRASGAAVLPVALRIGGTEGAPLGVAVAYIDLAWLEARLQERSHVPGSSLTVADRAGTILARVPEPERFVGTLIPVNFQYLLTQPAPDTLELTSQDGTRRVIGYSPVTVSPAGIYVSAGFPTEEAFASTEAIAARGSLIGAAGIAMALLLAIYTSRVFVIGPVGTLICTVQAWRDGRTDVRTEMSAADGEIGKAGEEFDGFIEELLAAREARQAAETQRQVLLAELDHRVKNLLTMVQSIARQSFGKVVAEPEMQAFARRLQAMSEANSLLRQEHWQSASLGDLVTSALTPFVEVSSGRLTISGPPLYLRSGVVLAFSMALHELATNASKYGALSNETGRVSIDWAVVTLATEGRFELTWREQGGPTVAEPTKRGFGSTVIERVLSGQIAGKVTMTYDPNGLVCRVTAPVEKVLADGYVQQPSIST